MSVRKSRHVRQFLRASEARLDEAGVLRSRGYTLAAVYLAGYAVECGLKACIVKRVTAAAGVIFEDRKFSDRCWTHSIDELVKLADVDVARQTDNAINPALKGNWLVVCAWNEQARYRTTLQGEAEKLFKAVTDPTNGVMSWIRVRW